MIRTHFVNHSAVVIETADWRVLCDPWLHGTVFADGWRLLHEDDGVGIADFDVNAIWISHEHPDHFSVPDFRAVPPDARARVPVMFQRTPDQKVAQYLAGQGFDVIELDLETPVAVTPQTTIWCGSTGGFDSWLAVQSNGVSVLNLNDCRASDDDLRRIRELLPDLDLLMTQYGYANWAGNPGDDRLPQKAREAMFDQIEREIVGLAPTAVLPFASFVFFGHEENAFWNERAITPEDALTFFERLGVPAYLPRPGTDLEITAPGDVTSTTENADAVAFWNDAVERAWHEPLVPTQPKTWAEVEAAFGQMQEKVRAGNDWDAIVAAHSEGALPAATVHVTDLGVRASLDLVHGLAESDEGAGAVEADISMSSEMLHYVLQHPWGRGTLSVNGRFAASYESLWKFFRQTSIWYGNNVGRTYPDDIELSDASDRNTFILEFVQDEG